MALKLNIGTKEGKTFQKDISDEESKALIGKQIGDKVSGNPLGFQGYEFEITGGSDNAGFPMRRDVSGTGRKKVLITPGVGFRAKKKGLRERRTVAGNMISSNTVQVNMKVVKEGKQPLEGAEEPSGESEAGGEEAEEGKQEKEEPKKEESEETAEKEEDAEEENTEEAAEEGPSEKESSEEKD